MRTQYDTASSLDGFIATEEDSLDWLFPLGDLGTSTYPAFIAGAAAGGKNAWIVGGGDLAGQFHDAGLLDELIVQVGSVTLGRGKPLFPRRVLSPVLRLVAVQRLGPSMVGLRYEIEPGGAASASHEP